MIAFLTLELRIEHAQSLKDKRQVVRSLKDRLRASFNVSVAELDPSSLWNQATIGVLAVSRLCRRLDEERGARREQNHQQSGSRDYGFVCGVLLNHLY